MPFPQSQHWALNVYTVEPPNKGHFGSGAFVLYSEVVLWWEVRLNLQFLATSNTQISTKHVLKHKTCHLYPAYFMIVHC